jgi:hypothetical protein
MPFKKIVQYFAFVFMPVIVQVMTILAEAIPNDLLRPQPRWPANGRRGMATGKMMTGMPY